MGQEQSRGQGKWGRNNPAGRENGVGTIPRGGTIMRMRVIVPDRKITLANSFRRNISASEYVPPEQFRGEQICCHTGSLQAAS